MKKAAFLFVVTFIVFVVAANNDSALLGLLSFAVAAGSALYFIFAALKKIWRAANSKPAQTSAPGTSTKDAPCPAKSIQITVIHYSGTYFTKIAGINFHNSKKDIGSFLGYVCAEPDNPYDKNAIAVHRNDGKLVGYIPKDETQALREWSDKDNLPCIGFVNVGEYVPLYGNVKIIDENEFETNLEIAKFVKWLVENFGTKFVPHGIILPEGVKLRTQADWISYLDIYITETENAIYGDDTDADENPRRPH